jgi:protein subunit release factor A
MIDSRDLKIDVYRSKDASGVVGGAIRITHIPTGLVVTREVSGSLADARAEALAEIEERLRESAG